MQRSEEEHKARVWAHLESGQLIVLGNTPIGLIKVVKSACEWKLLQLQIIPEQQGNGIATTLVTNLLREARCASMPVVLTVLKNNPAKRLYERLGFSVTGEREFVYEMQAG
ncbi:GNAT family N-acetyltransferase [Pseudomonas luteola]|uniref:GNAT family N-acetyltransferase n=1 Tax=Pseudomonas luteola TaxID=47886 RepID=UPI00388FBFF1